MNSTTKPRAAGKPAQMNIVVTNQHGMQTADTLRGFLALWPEVGAATALLIQSALGRGEKYVCAVEGGALTLTPGAPDGFNPIQARRVRLLGTDGTNVANEGTATAINPALHRVWLTDDNGKTFDYPMGNVQGLEALAPAPTPGPWKLHGSLPFVVDPRNLEVIANCDSARARPFDQDRVNAQLISAAPDLLHALKMALWYLNATPAEREAMERNAADATDGSMGDLEARIGTANDAIAKAEGREA